MTPPTMHPSGCILAFLLLVSTSHALSNAEFSSIVRRQLLTIPENGDLPDNYENQVKLNLTFENPRLRKAYIALQAWKKAMYSDPENTTANWVGPDVCKYEGVFCAEAEDKSKENVVAGIDLNHADIAGYLPVELGLLTDIALFHINSNRFCGIIPKSFGKMKLLYELDLSNNRFVGPFPEVVTSLPSLKFLDIRYNDFEGEVPSTLFQMKLDALFLNNNRFTSSIPETLGCSTASVVVLANNKFTGCIPSNINEMNGTLNEIVFLNNKLSGCLPGLCLKTSVSCRSWRHCRSRTTTSMEKLKFVYRPRERTWKWMMRRIVCRKGLIRGRQRNVSLW